MIDIDRILLCHKFILWEDRTENPDYTVLSIPLLESAVNSAFASYDGIDFYPTIQEKAVRIGYGIIKNHPFVDGNKRTGMYVMAYIIRDKGLRFPLTNSQMESIGYSIADGTFTYEQTYEKIFGKSINENVKLLNAKELKYSKKQIKRINKRAGIPPNPSEYNVHDSLYSPQSYANYGHTGTGGAEAQSPTPSGAVTSSGGSVGECIHKKVKLILDEE